MTRFYYFILILFFIFGIVLGLENDTKRFLFWKIRGAYWHCLLKFPWVTSVLAENHRRVTNAQHRAASVHFNAAVAHFIK